MCRVRYVCGESVRRAMFDKFPGTHQCHAGNLCFISFQKPLQFKRLNDVCGIKIKLFPSSGGTLPNFKFLEIYLSLLVYTIHINKSFFSSVIARNLWSQVLKASAQVQLVKITTLVMKQWLNVLRHCAGTSCSLIACSSAISRNCWRRDNIHSLSLSTSYAKPPVHRRLLNSLIKYLMVDRYLKGTRANRQKL